MMTTDKSCDARTAVIDCAVVGTGPVGLAAAVALATVGINVTLIGHAAPTETAVEASSPSGSGADTRTAALFPAVIALLRQLGAWESIEPECAPLCGIRIVDATRAMLRAPEVMFNAVDADWPNFGFNVPQSALSRGLWQAVRSRSSPSKAGRVEIIDGNVVGLETGAHERGSSSAAMTGAEASTIVLADGRRLRSTLVVAADGRNSLCRSAAGMAVRSWTYPQTAVATRFRHSRPHRGISTELHTRAGPCTTVPLPGNQSSLVWVERPDEASRLAELSNAEFLGALEQRLDGLLGTLSELGPRRSFPLTGLAAEPVAGHRVALVGEAGHVLPPIGAQGLNLGLADVAVLADTIAAARRSGADIGGQETLRLYATARQSDISRRSGAVDVINRMLISALLPVSFARGFGLHLIAASPALRKRLMREGLQPPEPLPTLMREGAATRDGAAAHFQRASR